MRKRLILPVLIFILLGSLGTALGLDLERVKISFLNGNYSQAIVDGEKLLAKSRKNSPNLDELYYIMGLCYLKDGNFLRASDIFEIIIDEFDNSPWRNEAKIGLGDTFYLREKYADAQNYYQGILKQGLPDKLLPQVYFRLSRSAAKLNQPQQAEEYLSKLKKDFPNALAAAPDLDAFSPDLYYTVQVGAFSSSNNARGLKEKLLSQGFSAYLEKAALQGKITYRVRVGKFSNRREAEDLEARLSQKGYSTKIFP
jgi:tetratricopeptide (TPR) repeat protein